MGATSACQSAPATQRTARLHTEQRRSRKEVVMKGIVAVAFILLDDQTVEGLSEEAGSRLSGRNLLVT